MTQLIGVPTPSVPQYWARALPWIEGACRRHGLMTPDYVRDRIDDREWQLWLAIEGEEVIAVLISEINTFPLGWVCNFVIGTGKQRHKWEHFRHDLARWAKAQGCIRMRLEARPGWKRIFKGYRSTHVILEMEL